MKPEVGKQPSSAPGGCGGLAGVPPLLNFVPRKELGSQFYQDWMTSALDVDSDWTWKAHCRWRMDIEVSSSSHPSLTVP